MHGKLPAASPPRTSYGVPYVLTGHHEQNLDIFTLLREPTERVGRKTANAKAKANIKRDENML